METATVCCERETFYVLLIRILMGLDTSDFLENCRENSYFIKIRQKQRPLYMKTIDIFDDISLILLRMRNVLNKSCR